MKFISMLLGIWSCGLEGGCLGGRVSKLIYTCFHRPNRFTLKWMCFLRPNFFPLKNMQETWHMMSEVVSVDSHLLTIRCSLHLQHPRKRLMNSLKSPAFFWDVYAVYAGSWYRNGKSNQLPTYAA
jgi:hypothetical protein